MPYSEIGERVMRLETRMDAQEKTVERIEASASRTQDKLEEVARKIYAFMSIIGFIILLTEIYDHIRSK